MSSIFKIPKIDFSALATQALERLGLVEHPESPMFVLTLSQVTRVLILIVVMAVLFHPYKELYCYLNERRRRKFADFIFRRLLCQLETIIRDSRPDNHVERHEAICNAIALFRRDVHRVLFPRHLMHSMGATVDYYVLTEEEGELRAVGYGSANVKVTIEFLQNLLNMTGK